jgi:hypothetical protein
LELIALYLIRNIPSREYFKKIGLKSQCVVADRTTRLNWKNSMTVANERFRKD